MNNTQFITVILGFITLLLAILGGAWLNQRGLEKQMESFRAEIKAELNAHKAELKAELQALRAEFVSLRAEFATLSERVTRIERQLEAIFKPVLPK